MEARGISKIMIEELDCLMQTVSRNTGINNSVSEGSEVRSVVEKTSTLLENT